MIENLKLNIATNPNIFTHKFGKKVFPERYRSSDSIIVHSVEESLRNIRFYYQNSETMILEFDTRFEKKHSPSDFENKTKDDCQPDLSSTEKPLLKIKLGKRCFPEMSKTTTQDLNVKPSIKCFPKKSLQSSHSTFFDSLLNPVKSIYHTKSNLRENGVFLKNSKNKLPSIPTIEEIKRKHSS